MVTYSVPVSQWYLPCLPPARWWSGSSPGPPCASGDQARKGGNISLICAVESNIPNRGFDCSVWAFLQNPSLPSHIPKIEFVCDVITYGNGDPKNMWAPIMFSLSQIGLDQIRCHLVNWSRWLAPKCLLAIQRTWSHTHFQKNHSNHFNWGTGMSIVQSLLLYAPKIMWVVTWHKFWYCCSRNSGLLFFRQRVKNVLLLSLRLANWPAAEYTCIVSYSGNTWHHEYTLYMVIQSPDLKKPGL